MEGEREGRDIVRAARSDRRAGGREVQSTPQRATEDAPSPQEQPQQPALSGSVGRGCGAGGSRNVKDRSHLGLE